MPFPCESGGEASQVSVCGHHAVAGDKDGQRVFSAGVGNCPACAGAAYDPGKFAVGFCFPGGNPGNGLPDLLLKVSAFRFAKLRLFGRFSGQGRNDKFRGRIAAAGFDGKGGFRLPGQEGEGAMNHPAVYQVDFNGTPCGGDLNRRGLNMDFRTLNDL